MGFLDHSTNNLILDAVLTDYGRQQLASANNSFNIAYYALADDEVDYRMIKKYGRAVGKEKIEKNTPIFEALTNPSVALKYRLVGRENDGSVISTIYMPQLTSNSTITLGTGTGANGNFSNVAVKLTYNGKADVPATFVQTSYTIKVPDRFLYLRNPGNGGTLTAPDVAKNSIDAGDPNRVATYTYICSPGQTTISFDVYAQSIDNMTLSVYGKRTGNGNERVINTFISVIGNNHGSTIDLAASYTASTTA